MTSITTGTKTKSDEIMSYFRRLSKQMNLFLEKIDGIQPQSQSQLQSQTSTSTDGINGSTTTQKNQTHGRRGSKTFSTTNSSDDIGNSQVLFS